MRLHDDAVRLVESFGGPVVFRQLLGSVPDAARPDLTPDHLTASALVVDAATRRVLLCDHPRVGAWVQLGGHVEAGDASLAGAALREATEESGIAGLVVHPEPIGFDVHPVRCRYGSSRHFDVRFAVLAPAGAVAVCSSESRALGWFAPDALPTPLGDAVDCLVAPALARYT